MTRLAYLISSLTMTFILFLGVISLHDVPSAHARERVAVIDFKVAKSKDGKKVVNDYEADALTEALRTAITDLNLYSVMTKENMYAMLEPGTRLEDCIGKCEVETGKNLQARYVLTGEIGKLGGKFDLLIRLFHTESSELLSSKNVSGATVDDVRTKLSRMVRIIVE